MSFDAELSFVAGRHCIVFLLCRDNERTLTARLVKEQAAAHSIFNFFKEESVALLLQILKLFTYILN